MSLGTLVGGATLIIYFWLVWDLMVEKPEPEPEPEPGEEREPWRTETTEW